MSDTPRTDAMIAADQHHLEDDNFFPSTVYWRMCDIARELERELALVTEQRDRLAEAIKRHKEALHPCTSEKADTELWKALAAVEGGAP